MPAYQTPGADRLYCLAAKRVMPKRSSGSWMYANGRADPTTTAWLPRFQDGGGPGLRIRRQLCRTAPAAECPDALVSLPDPPAPPAASEATTPAASEAVTPRYARTGAGRVRG
jgi:hypothetical protein